MMWKKLSLSEEEDSKYSERTIAMIGGKAIAAKFFTLRQIFSLSTQIREKCCSKGSRLDRTSF